LGGGSALDGQPESRAVVSVANILPLGSQCAGVVKKNQCFAESLLVEADIPESDDGIWVVGRIAKNLSKSCRRCIEVLAPKRLEALLSIGVGEALLLLRAKGLYRGL